MATRLRPCLGGIDDEGSHRAGCSARSRAGSGVDGESDHAVQCLGVIGVDEVGDSAV